MALRLEVLVLPTPTALAHLVRATLRVAGNARTRRDRQTAFRQERRCRAAESSPRVRVGIARNGRSDGPRHGDWELKSTVR